MPAAEAAVIAPVNQRKIGNMYPSRVFQPADDRKLLYRSYRTQRISVH